ncbi:MAG TPA: TrkA family potassium uptake protein [Chloroflexota bacterium]|nr:TrkA family potassium uptake protein [Chloroflexota bacterium]
MIVEFLDAQNLSSTELSSKNRELADGILMDLARAVRICPSRPIGDNWIENLVTIIIIGAGRVGAGLANALDEQHDVRIIDVDAAAFRRIKPGFRGDTLSGNGIDIDVLRDAGADRADVVIAVTNGDNRNLMAAQVAKTIFQVKQVVARVYDPARADVFQEIGIDTFSPTVSGAERLYQQIVSG